MTDQLIFAGVVLVIGMVAIALRLRARLWTDEEYERKKGAGTAAGNAFLTIQSMFDSGARHAVEQRTAEAAEKVDSGAPPDPARPGA